MKRTKGKLMWSLSASGRGTGRKGERGRGARIRGGDERFVCS